MLIRSFHVMLFRSTRLLSQRIHLVVSVDLSVKKIGTPTRLWVGYGIICVGVSCASRLRCIIWNTLLLTWWLQTLNVTIRLLLQTLNALIRLLKTFNSSWDLLWQRVSICINQVSNLFMVGLWTLNNVDDSLWGAPAWTLCDHIILPSSVLITDHWQWRVIMYLWSVMRIMYQWSVMCNMYQWSTMRIMYQWSIIRIMYQWSIMRIMYQWSTMRIMYQWSIMRVMYQWSIMRIMYQWSVMRIMHQWSPMRIMLTTWMHKMTWCGSGLICAHCLNKTGASKHRGQWCEINDETSPWMGSNQWLSD